MKVLDPREYILLNETCQIFILLLKTFLILNFAHDEDFLKMKNDPLLLEYGDGTYKKMNTNPLF